jgi:hypothetical protein
LPENSESNVADYLAASLSISQLSKKPSNWSHGEIAAPNQKQVSIAYKALLEMLFKDVVFPKIMLLNDGTLGAYWSRSDFYASVDFEEDGEFPWAVARRGALNYGVWKLADGFPKELEAAIRED